MIISFTFSACKKTEEKKIEVDFKSAIETQSFAKNYLYENFQLKIDSVFILNFSSDSLKSLVAFQEISNDKEAGMKIFNFTIGDTSLTKTFESNLLDGSIEGSSIQQVTLPEFTYQLLYYNSLDYFTGSRGGDIFLYLVDSKLNEIYYAHLSIIAKRNPRLFISENTKLPTVRKFFNDELKNDFPNLVISRKDIKSDL